MPFQTWFLSLQEVIQQQLDRPGAECFGEGVVRDIVECRSVVSGCLVVVLHVTVAYPWFCVSAETFKGSFQGECGPIQLFYKCFWLTNTLSVDSTCR